MVRALQGPVRTDCSAICPDNLTNKASSPQTPVAEHWGRESGMPREGPGSASSLPGAQHQHTGQALF